MLTIDIYDEQELWDEVTETFAVEQKELLLQLRFEHSLVSLSKWESKFQKPFLGMGAKTSEEILSYIEMMCLNDPIPPNLFQMLQNSHITEINDYIESKQSATTFGNMPKSGGRSETVTSELIYYWMVAFNIPFVCETWHLNRLFSLIRVCNLKNSKPSKRSRHEIAESYRQLNEQRKAQLGTSG